MQKFPRRLQPWKWTSLWRWSDEELTKGDGLIEHVEAFQRDHQEEKDEENEEK